MKNRVAKLVKYSFGPTSCLAASLAEFELFIHEICRFALPRAKIQSCQVLKNSLLGESYIFHCISLILLVWGH